LAAGTSSSMVPTSSSTTPTLRAFDGLMRSPLSSTDISAFWMPSRRTVRTTPPAPGRTPSIASGSPIRLPGTSAAMRWWQASASSSPPPSAAPLMEATTGLPSSSSRRRSALIRVVESASSWASSGPALITWVRSAPAKKVVLADVITTPVISSTSSCRRPIVAPISSM